MFALLAGLIYLNQVGFPGSYGLWVRQELAKHQLHLDFDSLRFSLDQGLIATDVKFFTSPTDGHATLTAEELIIDLDKSLALRGEFALREIFITGATTHFQAADDIEPIQGHNIQSKIYLDAGNRIRLREATALVQGLQLQLSADLKYSEPDPDHSDEGGGPQLEYILRPILAELARWQIPKDSPPSLKVSFSGDLSKPESFQTKFSLSAEKLTRNDYAIESLTLEGDVENDLITLDHILLKDQTGQAQGQADWRVNQKEGRFHLSSSLQFQHLLKNCFDLEVAPKLQINSSPEILVDGVMQQRDGGKFSIRATGKARMGAFTFVDNAYDALSSSFSWQDGDLFLQGLEVDHPEGRLEGDILAQGPQIRYDLRSTLPLSAFRPFLPDQGPAARTISDFHFQKKSQLSISLSGTANRKNLKEWHALGRARIANFAYRDLKLHQLETSLEISSRRLEFKSITLLIDDREEHARVRFNGPPSGEIYVDTVLYQPRDRKLIISNLRGEAWPTPFIRAFAPKAANNIEKNYRFHRPPQLTLNGSFDCTLGSVEHNAYMVSVRTTGQTDYPFLKRVLPLTHLTADIYFRKRELNVANLAFHTLQGRSSGEIHVSFQKDGSLPQYRGDLKWRDISFRDISKLYQFKEEEKGQLTGRFHFTGVGGEVRKLSGRGFLSLHKGNIVSLPVFGPLSPLLAGILGDQRMGYERAKDASGSFIVRNGLWQTDDFLAVSTSLNLTGVGWIDLASDQIDMTIRLNARGLLGIITLPLAPIKGLFQFRGTGQFTDSKWKSSPFTQPKLGKKDPLYRPVGKAIIVPE